MKNRTQYILASVLVGLFAVLLATESDASWNNQKSRRKSSSKKAGGSFCVSGIYTGKIDKRIYHDGTTYRIADDTMIYVVGSGFKERGIYVSKASVLMQGERKAGLPIVRTLLVRSAEASHSTYFTDPKIPTGAIPSEVNQNVGELAEDNPQ